MYSVTTGEQTRLLQGHTNTCVGTAINPENPLQLYTFSLDCTLRVWDYNDAILLNVRRAETLERSTISLLPYLPDHQVRLSSVFIRLQSKT